MPGNPRTSKSFAPELVDEIVNWISEGRTLRAFCRQPGKPSWRTIYDWMDADAEFSARIAKARDLGADAIAEETLAIADTPQEGKTTTVDKDGVRVVTEDMLGHRKLQVWTRLQLLAKWNPKKYGERLDTTLRGDAAHPIAISSTEAKL